MAGAGAGEESKARGKHDVATLLFSRLIPLVNLKSKAL